MKITFDWLKDHLKTNLKEETLIENLTNIGLEVEGIANLYEGFDLFKVAKIIKTEKHPNADRLKVCFIDVGGGSTELTLIKNNEVLISKSFKIGGVRLINNLVNKSTWNKFGNWIENNLSSKRDIKVN